MLKIKIDKIELYDERTERFVYSKEGILSLEHSLISVSKWEAKWKKPFLETPNKTYEETIDYIRCMSLNGDVDPRIYMGITADKLSEIHKYINDEMTATWFSNKSENRKISGKKQIVTSELIYYWMIAYEIPFECEKWHLNRLLTLIKICEIKNQPSKKMKRKDILSSNRSLNEARKRAIGTKG